MKSLTIFLVGLLLIAGCSGAAKKKAKSGPVDYKMIAEGQHSQADTASVYIIDNASQWAEAWGIAYANIDPMPEPPKIDFEKSMVLAAFMGQKNSGGYKIDISGVQLKNDTLDVTVTNHTRAGGTMLPVLTSPFQFVEVPKGDYKLHVETKQASE